MFIRSSWVQLTNSLWCHIKVSFLTHFEANRLAKLVSSIYLEFDRLDHGFSTLVDLYSLFIFLLQKNLQEVSSEQPVSVLILLIKFAFLSPWELINLSCGDKKFAVLVIGHGWNITHVNHDLILHHWQQKIKLWAHHIFIDCWPRESGLEWNFPKRLDHFCLLKYQGCRFSSLTIN